MDLPWRCPWSGKQDFTFAPDFSGIDPDTGEPWMPSKVVEYLGLRVESADATRAACEAAVAKFPKEAAAYRTGKKNLLGFFMKDVLDSTQRQADPKEASRILAELLA